MDIFQFEFYDEISDSTKTYSLGVIHEQTSIDLFLVSNSIYDQLGSAYDPFVKDTANVCLKILNEYCPDKKLQDIDWSYTAGGGHSDFYFDFKGGLATSLTFPNGAVLEPYCSALPVEEYEKALNDPRTLKEALLDGYPSKAIPSFSGEPRTVYLVHTPFHPDKSIHQVTPPLHNMLDDNPVVLVDAQKFIMHWKNQSEPKPKYPKKSLKGLLEQAMECIEEGSTHNFYDADNHKLLQSTLATTLKHYIPDEMAFGVGISPKSQQVYFSNGRHRTVNFANLGAPYIPVQTSTHNLTVFQALFEWNPDSAIEHSMSMEC